MVAMGYKFRAPKEKDLREWQRIEDALREGQVYIVPKTEASKF